MAKKKKTTKGKEVDMQKTTLRLPKELWKAAKIHAIEVGRDYQDIIAEALGEFLKRKKRKGGRE